MRDKAFGVILWLRFCGEESLKESMVTWKLPADVLQGGEGKLRFCLEEKKKKKKMMKANMSQDVKSHFAPMC